MKLEQRITIPVHDTLEKYIILSIVFCLASFALPVHSQAENELPQASGSLPSYNGRLDLSVQDENSIKEEKNNIPETEQYAAETNGSANRQSPKSKEIRLNGMNGSSIGVAEDGSNLIIVQGSRYPQDYGNYANHNNGFYMNITNPDGSSMNFGSYFNSSTGSNAGRRQSRSQIIVDKIE